jgi:uncharacterized protein (TIGR03083 family)
MLAQAVDFQAEADELQTLLATLGASDWERATLFKGWTVNDIVQHLHDGDLMAAASVVGPESLRDSGMSRLQETRDRLGHLIGKHLLGRWHAQVTDLCDKLSALPQARD